MKISKEQKLAAINAWLEHLSLKDEFVKLISETFGTDYNAPVYFYIFECFEMHTAGLVAMFYTEKSNESLNWYIEQKDSKTTGGARMTKDGKNWRVITTAEDILWMLE